MSEFKNCCTTSRNSNNSITKDQNIRTSSRNDLTNGMIKLSGDSFFMGTKTDEGFSKDGEGPVRETEVDAFWIDETTVTNNEFAKFIRNTGYKTEAERYGWSYVFVNFLPEWLQDKDLPYLSRVAKGNLTPRLSQNRT